MKNKFLITLIMLFFIVLLMNVQQSIAAPGGTYDPNTEEIKIVNQDPIIAMPGDYVRVVFEVSGLRSNNGYAVKLVPKYPFSLDQSSSATQTFAGAPYSQNFKQSWMIPYTLRVADDALEGNYTLELLSHSGSSIDFESSYTSYYQKEFEITVGDLQTNFATVIQEASGTQISLGIVNTGKNIANALIVAIPEQESFKATGISEQIVGNLAAGDYTIVNFNVAPKSSFGKAINIEGSQPLKVKIDYTDGLGERRSVIKEVQMESALLQGNFTRPGQGIRQTSTGTSTWWYVLGIVVIVIIGFIVYKKYGNKIKDFNPKKGSKKGISDEISNAPDWVLAEKTRKK